MNGRNVIGISNPKVRQRSVDRPVTVRGVSPMEDEMIPKDSKHAPGIEGDDRPENLPVKRSDDKSDDL